VDTIVLVGKFDPRITRLLTVLGYGIKTSNSIADLSHQLEASDNEQVDLILIDGRLEIDFPELAKYLRDYEITQEIPVIILSKDESLEKELLKLKLQRVEVLAEDLSPGLLASRLATTLRLRKFDGQEEKASLADANAALRSHNQHMLKELEEARRIQSSLLPKSLPSSEAFDLAISFEPLEEVGGDWFFVEQIGPDQIQVYIADVTGHGLAAAFISSMTKLAMTAAEADNPAGKVAKMNALITPQLSDGRFITLFCYSYQISTGALEFVRAGHPPALLLKQATAKVKILQGDGFALGFFEDSEYQSQSESLDPGDILLIMTDGYPEAQNRSNQQYGYDRMSEILKDVSNTATSQEVISLIAKDFKEFLGGRILKDDLTMIVLKRLT